MATLLQSAAIRTFSALRDTIYPLTCVLCDTRVDTPGLCAQCWRETPFIAGATCGMCGTSLPGQTGDGTCDECLQTARPWDEGRAALAYSDKGRTLVLQLKHGDRTELADAAATWIHRRARDLLTPDTVFAPVPLHRLRLAQRRYNQSALIARRLAKQTGGVFAPMTLHRTRRTPSQDRRSKAERFENMKGAIALNGDVAGRHIALVDDVMTSGATLAACADALRGGGAKRISVLVLARVARDS